MKFFTKLTDFFSHAQAVADTILDLVEKGVAIDEGIVAKAKGIVGTARKFVPEQEKAPTTIMIPVPDEHAAALGAK